MDVDDGIGGIVEGEDEVMVVEEGGSCDRSQLRVFKFSFL